MREQHSKKCGKACNSQSPRIVRSDRKTVTGFIVSAIIAILPKCPICALAYSTAITMCSGKVFDHQPDWTSYISIALAAFILGLVLWNYKGVRTIAASALIVAGGVVIFNSEIFSGNVAHYYMGCGIVLLGVWTNGSLLHFVRKWTGSSNSQKSITVEVNGTT